MKNLLECHFDGVGRLILSEENGNLTELLFADALERPQEIDINETPLLLEARRQLEEYFSGSRKRFELPLAPKGTPFQLRCWKELLKVPYGATATYGDIARAVGCPKGFRAVGMASHRNPISIIIPCHRIIGSNGKLTGFGGGLERKSFLLLLEAQHLNA